MQLINLSVQLLTENDAVYLPNRQELIAPTCFYGLLEIF